MRGGHSFATVMNSSHFTIHVVGIFIGQGAKAPLAPMKLRPCMRRKFVVLKQLCFTLAIVKVDKLDHLDKSLSELDHVTVILGLKGKIMTTDELDCCKENEPPRMVSKLLKCKNFFPLRYVK